MIQSIELKVIQNIVFKSNAILVKHDSQQNLSALVIKTLVTKQSNRVLR